MPQKLLQKARNRYLQQTPFENLIPNKHIGKNKKNRSITPLFLTSKSSYKKGKSVTLFSQYSHMEKDICNQWAFSWNVLEKKMPQQDVSTLLPAVSGLINKTGPTGLSKRLTLGLIKQKKQRKREAKKRILMQVLTLLGTHYDTEFVSFANPHPKYESAPYVADKLIPHHTLSDHMSCRCLDFSEATAKLAKQKSNLASLVPDVRKALMEPQSSTYKINRVIGGNISQLVDRHVDLQIKSVVSPSPQKNMSRLNVSFKEELEKITKKKIRNACNVQHTSGSFFIQWDTEYSSVADFLRQQIHCNFWNGIFSLSQLGALFRARDRITDQYRNQYAECRKISILYGNLSKRTLIRTMRYAKKEGENIDSKFLSLLERRLDVVLKRLLFFPTINAARQWISQGKILVNNSPCTICSYLLQPADLVTISQQAQNGWRTEWRKSFNEKKELEEAAFSFGNSASKNTSGLQSPWHSHVKRLQTGLDLRMPLLFRKRRFLFSPFLMQKWEKWSKLWENSLLFGSVKKHKWTHKDKLRKKQGLHSHSSFANSVLASFLKSKQTFTPFFISRRETIITFWLRIVGAHLMKCCTARKKGFFQKVFYSPGSCTSGCNNYVQQQMFRKKTKLGLTLALRAILHAVFLHRQRKYVIDGLYMDRWNKIFAGEKSVIQKREKWRSSFLKPTHLECSYKNCSAVFLYVPQKLVWPSNINVLLLRKALVC